MSGSPPWCIIRSWWQPSGRLRLAVVLISPGGRVKLASGAGPLSGRTTSCRPSHPSPKLSNSCTRTRAASCSSGGATGGGGGSTGNGGRPTGGAEGSTEGGCVEGGGAEGEAAGQTRAPKAASINIAARTSLRVTRASSASVSESFSPCARRETRASRSSIAVRCISSRGGCSHSLTVGPIPAAIWYRPSEQSEVSYTPSAPGEPLASVWAGLWSGEWPRGLSVLLCIRRWHLSMLRHQVGVDHDAP